MTDILLTVADQNYVHLGWSRWMERLNITARKVARTLLFCGTEQYRVFHRRNGLYTWKRLARLSCKLRCCWSHAVRSEYRRKLRKTLFSWVGSNRSLIWERRCIGLAIMHVKKLYFQILRVSIFNSSKKWENSACSQYITKKQWMQQALLLGHWIRSTKLRRFFNQSKRKLHTYQLRNSVHCLLYASNRKKRYRRMLQLYQFNKNNYMLQNCFAVWYSRTKANYESSSIVRYFITSTYFERWIVRVESTFSMKIAENRAILRNQLKGLSTAISCWQIWSSQKRNYRRRFRVFRLLHPCPACAVPLLARIVSSWRNEFVPHSKSRRKVYNFIVQQRKRRLKLKWFEHWIEKFNFVIVVGVLMRRAWKKLFYFKRRGISQRKALHDKLIIVSHKRNRRGSTQLSNLSDIAIRSNLEKILAIWSNRARLRSFLRLMQMKLELTRNDAATIRKAKNVAVTEAIHLAQSKKFVSYRSQLWKEWRALQSWYKFVQKRKNKIDKINLRLIGPKWFHRWVRKYNGRVISDSLHINKCSSILDEEAERIKLPTQAAAQLTKLKQNILKETSSIGAVGYGSSKYQANKKRLIDSSAGRAIASKLENAPQRSVSARSVSNLSRENIDRSNVSMRSMDSSSMLDLSANSRVAHPLLSRSMMSEDRESSSFYRRSYTGQYEMRKKSGK